MAVQVQQAVNEVERTFALRIVREFSGLTEGSVGADEDFAVLESDDIGGRRIVHKLRVDLRDPDIINEGNLYVLKITEHRRVRAGLREDERQCGGGGLEKAVQVERERGLMIIEFQGGHVAARLASARALLQA